MPDLSFLTNEDAFSNTSLTATFNEIPHVPGRAGQLAFAGIAAGISTTAASIEMQANTLTVVPTTPRGAPAPKEGTGRRKLFTLDVPHIQTEDTLYASSFQDVRDFGTGGLKQVETEVNKHLNTMAQRLDLTLEHHELGALKGVITDADGSVLTDLFSEFEVLNSSGIAAPEQFSFDLEETASETVDLRVTCQKVQRFMRDAAGTIIPPGAKVWAFCGHDFFDALVSREDVKRVYDGYAAAQQALGGSYAYSVFEYGGIFFEDYQGAGIVSVASDECRLFWSEFPALYSESFAPGDFLDSVNQIGTPRYARMAVDPKFGQYVELHAETNPLPICLRPQTLVKGLI